MLTGDWESAEHRNKFLSSATNKPFFDAIVAATSQSPVEDTMYSVQAPTVRGPRAF